MFACLWAQSEHKGVRVRRVDPTVPVAASVKEGDILLSFDGIQIGNDGASPLRQLQVVMSLPGISSAA